VDTGENLEEGVQKDLKIPHPKSGEEAAGDSVPREDWNDEGRVVTCDIGRYYVVFCYVPNSGGSLNRLAYRVTEWDNAFHRYVKTLDDRSR
jgi:exonuclease III